MEDSFREWQEDFNPFDAIGFPVVGLQPPAPGDFCKAVRYALFATQPERLRLAGAVAPKLPYTWEQVKLATDFFTGASQEGADWQQQDGPDTVVWQWTFHDIIEYQCHSRYRRTWAPERRRWEHMILDPPVDIAIGEVASPRAQRGYHNSDAALSQSQQPQPQLQSQSQSQSQSQAQPQAQPCSSRASRRTNLGSVNATASTTPDNDRGGKNTGNRLVSMPPPQDDGDNNNDNHDNDDIPFTITVRLPKRKETDIRRSTGANAIRARPLAAGTFAAGKSILLGWPARQLDLAAENATADRDYRQAVFATITATGHIHIRLHIRNMLGQLVPPGYRLRGVTATPHRHIVYLPSFDGMSYDEIRREIGRQSLRQGVAAWVPTPAAREGGGDRNAGDDVPVRRPRGRPRGSKNKRGRAGTGGDGRCGRGVWDG
ncbi:hypothetical protein DL765_006334 [Monosporascus sp. GIB2]|nr:hypothetical protein DL765_006334 [Monosporascus sp. GIB2]